MKKSKAVDSVLEHLAAQESREITNFVFFTTNIKGNGTFSSDGSFKASDIDSMIATLKDQKDKNFRES